jgi:hypothetical protein
MSNRRRHRGFLWSRRTEKSVPQRYRRDRFISRKTTDADARYFEKRSLRRLFSSLVHMLTREANEA